MRSPEVEYGSGMVQNPTDAYMNFKRFDMPIKSVTPNLASGRHTRTGTPNHLSPNVKAHREYNNMSSLQPLQPQGGGSLMHQMQPK